MKLHGMPDPVSSTHSDVNPEELRTLLLSRATLLSETALKVLLCKRDKLVITLALDQTYTCTLKKKFFF